MNKAKISFEKIGKYLREISVVVIGVAITLSVSYWITSKTEKRDMALYMNTIKLELTENKKTLDEIEQHLQKSLNYTVYLLSLNQKLPHADTIRFYSDTYYIFPTFTLKTNAFDMFKTSGNMRLVRNKELLISIWDTYAVLVELQQAYNEIMAIKFEEMRKETQLVSLVKILMRSDEEILKNVPPMYDFHVNLQFYNVLFLSHQKTSTRLSETISKFK